MTNKHSSGTNFLEATPAAEEIDVTAVWCCSGNSRTTSLRVVNVTRLIPSLRHPGLFAMDGDQLCIEWKKKKIF